MNLTLQNPKRAFLICAAFSSFALPALAGDGNTPVLQQRPLSFIENKGQVTDQYQHSRTDVQFKVPGNGMNLFVGNGALHYMWAKETGSASSAANVTMPGVHTTDAHAASFEKKSYETYRLDVTLLGANPNAQVVKENLQEYTERYYLPSVSDGAEAHSYNKVTYTNIYPNIDWVIYSKDNGVKYDFVVRPGGNPSDIKLKYDGTTGIAMEGGALTVTTPLGTVTEQKPYTYDAQTKQVIASSYALNGNVLSFNVAANSGNLVIDPSINWATYYGTSGSDAGNGIKSDASGNIWVAGGTTSPANLVSVGAYQNFLNGTLDGILLRYNANGSLQYATYFGGNAEDRFNNLVVDGSGNVYAVGATLSSSGIGTAGTYQQFYGGHITTTIFGDAIVVKFNSSGQRVWGTYYGGNNADYGSNIAIDASGNLYICGITQSTSNIASSGVQQTSLYADEDGFVAKLNAANGTRIWGTYYGGEDNDELFSVGVDASGNVYAAGWTGSQANIVTAGAYQTINNSAGIYPEGYFVKYNSAGGAIFGTFWGGNDEDIIYSLALDPAGYVYLTGHTSSSSSIASSGAFQTSHAGGQFDGMIAKMNTSGVMQWSTYFGGNGNDQLRISTLNSKGYLWLGGTTTSNGIATNNAYQPSLSSQDGIFGMFSPTGTRIYASYFGGPGTTQMNGMSFGTGNSLLLSGYSSAYSGIATTGAQQTIWGGSEDAFIASFKVDTLVYITTPLTTPLCGGATLNVPYTVDNVFNSNNVFSVQLSDAIGFFATPPVIIGTLTANNDGTIVCTIPANIAPGTQYQVRILSSSPAYMYSQPGVTTLELNPVTTPTVQISATPNGAVGPYKSVAMTVSVTNGGLNPTFQWKKNGQAIPGATTPFLTMVAGVDFLNSDQITVDLTSNKPCATPASVTSAPQTMAISLGVNDATVNAATLYPNPTSGTFIIKGDVKVASVDATNAMGQLVFSTKTNSNEITLPASLPNGMYMIRLQTNKGEQHIKLSLQR